MRIDSHGSGIILIDNLFIWLLIFIFMLQTNKQIDSNALVTDLN